MWTVKVQGDARRAFKKLDGELQRQIVAALEALALLPDPSVRAKPLQYSLKGRYRLRIGSYRVIFTLNKKELVILVIDIGARDQIYK